MSDSIPLKPARTGTLSEAELYAAVKGSVETGCKMTPEATEQLHQKMENEAAEYAEKMRERKWLD